MQCKEGFSRTLKSAHFLIRIQNIVYILADLGKCEYCQTKIFSILKDRVGKVSILWTLILLKQKCNSVSRCQ